MVIPIEVFYLVGQMTPEQTIAHFSRPRFAGYLAQLFFVLKAALVELEALPFFFGEAVFAAQGIDVAEVPAGGFYQPAHLLHDERARFAVHVFHGVQALSDAVHQPFEHLGKGNRGGAFEHLKYAVGKPHAV